MIRRTFCAIFRGHEWRVIDLRFLPPSFPTRKLLFNPRDYDEKYGFTILRCKCSHCGHERKRKLLGDWSQIPQYTEELQELRKMAGLGGVSA